MNIFNKKKSKEKAPREKYLQEFGKMTVYANGVRMNEELIGQLQRLREIMKVDSSCQPKLQSSMSRPVDFKNNIAAWLEAVKNEARKLVCQSQLTIGIQ